MFALPRLDGKQDLQNIVVSRNQEALNWGRMLFYYFKSDAGRSTSPHSRLDSEEPHAGRRGIAPGTATYARGRGAGWGQKKAGRWTPGRHRWHKNENGLPLEVVLRKQII